MDHPTCQTRRPPSDLPTTLPYQSDPQLHLYHYLFPRLRLSKTIWLCFSAIATVHHYLYYHCFYESLRLFLTHTHINTHKEGERKRERESEWVSVCVCVRERDGDRTKTRPTETKGKRKIVLIVWGDRHDCPSLVSSF